MIDIQFLTETELHYELINSFLLLYLKNVYKMLNFFKKY